MNFVITTKVLITSIKVDPELITRCDEERRPRPLGELGEEAFTISQYLIKYSDQGIKTCQTEFNLGRFPSTQHSILHFIHE